MNVGWQQTTASTSMGLESCSRTFALHGIDQRVDLFARYRMGPNPPVFGAPKGENYSVTSDFVQRSLGFVWGVFTPCPAKPVP